MGNSNQYKNIIFTNHALQRIGERKMVHEMAWQTIYSPDIAIDGKRQGTHEFQKQFGTTRVTVIATQNNRQEWVVLSCWMDPPLPGTSDYKQRQRYQAYQKAGFWKKIWLTIMNQLGL